MSDLGGRYRIEEELGRGGLGVVWRARDLTLGRPVAVKAIQPGVLDVETLRRFEREAAVQARVRHAHLVEIYDYGEDGGRPFIVMELLEGHDLEELLASDSILTREAVEAVARVARAVETIHEADIVHRDIKPANVFVDREGIPYLGDFGIALDRSARERLTMTGSWVGTPAYMSPEQAGGELAIGPRSDVYALGAVLYRILAGKPPHEGSPIQILARIESGGGPSIGDLEGVDPELASIVGEALAPEPADRPARAADLAADLDDWLAADRPERVPGPAGSHPYLLVGGVVALVAAGILGVWSLLPDGEPSPDGPPSATRDEPVTEPVTPDDPPSEELMVEDLLREAEELERTGRVDEARGLLREMSPRANGPEVHLRAGRLAHGLGEAARVEDHLRPAVEAGIATEEDRRILDAAHLERLLGPGASDRAFEVGDGTIRSTGWMPDDHAALLPLATTRGSTWELRGEIRLHTADRVPHAGFFFDGSSPTTYRAVYLIRRARPSVFRHDTTEEAWEAAVDRLVEETGSGPELLLRYADLAPRRPYRQRDRPVPGDPDDWIPVRLSVEGTRFTLRVHGRTVFDDRDTGHRVEGSCGLIIYYGTQATWRHLRLVRERPDRASGD